MNKADTGRCLDLFKSSRWAALASGSGERLVASMVAYVASEDLSEIILHLSTLAAHTVNLQEISRCSLIISENDSGDGDPQELARLTVSGDAKPVDRDSDRYAQYREVYLQRLPASKQLFGFSDFQLFVLQPVAFNYVGGFARAYNLDLAEFLKLNT